jgi:hypothetical protein
MPTGKPGLNRRDLFKTGSGLAAGALLSREAAAQQPAQRNVNTRRRFINRRASATTRRTA